jgi:hypothetical protein
MVNSQENRSSTAQPALDAVIQSLIVQIKNPPPNSAVIEVEQEHTYDANCRDPMLPLI